MRSGRWLSVLMLSCACGCENSSTVETGSNCFDLCLEASADVDLDAHLSIAAGIAQSFELARAGLTFFANSSRALTGFVQSMVDLNPRMPSGLSYEGGGVYSAAPNASTRVELRFYLPSNTSYGADGDLIGFNLFDVSNYFTSFGVKASTTLSLSSGLSTSTGFTFDGMGPGAELLGIARTATSPVNVDVSFFSKQLSKVIVEARIIESKRSETSEIGFELATASRAVSAVGDAAIPLTLTEFTGAGFDLGQAITLNLAELSMRNAGAVYDGSIQLASHTSEFAFAMLFSFNASATADIVFGCPNAALEVPQ